MKALAFRLLPLALAPSFLVLGLLAAGPASAQPRGIEPGSFSATFYDRTDLSSYVTTKSWNQPWDFELPCWDESYPFNGCKLIPELTDGSDWSVRWTGTLVVPQAGNYTFRINADDGARLSIDGVEQVDGGWYWPEPDHRSPPQVVFLSAGPHTVTLDYEQRIHFLAILRVTWQGPGFPEETIPLLTGGGCEEMHVDPGTLSGFGWTMGYEVSEDDGLVLRAVRLGNRTMADKVSIPYYTLETNRFTRQRFELKPTCENEPGRSRLVGFRTGGDDKRVFVEARYRIDQLPGDAASALEITQHYEFRTVIAEGGCEPSHEIPGHVHEVFPCNPYKLSVDYSFTGAGGETLTAINVPQRIDFQVDGTSQNVAEMFQDRDGPGAVLGVIANREVVRTEGTFPGLVNGQQSDWDNLHQTSKGEVQEPGGGLGGPRPGQPAPGCPECTHVHWRWSDAVGNPEFGNGKPLIPRTDVHFDGLSYFYNSNQDLELGFSLWRAGEEDPDDFHDLLNGEGTHKADLVFWYSSTGHLASDHFWIHFGFFSASFVDLAVSIDDSPDPVPNGWPMTYSVHVANNGPGDATGVQVIMPGALAVADTVTLDRRCFVSYPDILCDLGDIRAGRTETVDVVLRSNYFPFPHQDITTWLDAAVYADQVDGLADNDQDHEETRLRVPSDLAIIQGSASPDPVRSGSDLTFRFQVRDQRNEDEQAVRVTVPLPANATFVSASANQGTCSSSAGQAVCDLGTLFSLRTGEVTVVVRPTRPGQISATARASSANLDLDSSNNSATARANVRP